MAEQDSTSSATASSCRDNGTSPPTTKQSRTFYSPSLGGQITLDPFGSGHRVCSAPMRPLHAVGANPACGPPVHEDLGLVVEAAVQKGYWRAQRYPRSIPHAYDHRPNSSGLPWSDIARQRAASTPGSRPSHHLQKSTQPLRITRWPSLYRALPPVGSRHGCIRRCRTVPGGACQPPQAARPTAETPSHARPVGGGEFSFSCPANCPRVISTAGVCVGRIPASRTLSGPPRRARLDAVSARSRRISELALGGQRFEPVDALPDGALPLQELVQHDRALGIPNSAETSSP